jgi:pyrophosphatase PpaX
VISAVLFDIDGTLTSLGPRYVDPVRQAVLNQIGHIPIELLDSILRDLFSSLGKKSKYIIVRSFWMIGRRLGLNVFDTIRFMLETRANYEESKHKFRLLEGAEESLEIALELGKVGLVTSAFKEDVEQAIIANPILGDVDVITTWDDVIHPKPHPEPLLQACQGLDLKPEEIMFVGDLPTDIMTAKSCGAYSTAFLGEYGNYTQSLLEPQQPNYLVRDHAELQQLIIDLLTLLPVQRIY